MRGRGDRTDMEEIPGLKGKGKHRFSQIDGEETKVLDVFIYL